MFITERLNFFGIGRAVKNLPKWMSSAQGCLTTGSRHVIMVVNSSGSACSAGAGHSLQNCRVAWKSCDRWVRFPCTSAILGCDLELRSRLAANDVAWL